MMNPSRLLISTFLTIFSSGVATSPAQTFEALKGNCAIAVSTRANKLELLLERGTCPAENDRDRLHDRDARRDCHSSQNDEPFDAFNGFVVSDLGRDVVSGSATAAELLHGPAAVQARETAL